MRPDKILHDDTTVAFAKTIATAMNRRVTTDRRVNYADYLEWLEPDTTPQSEQGSGRRFDRAVRYLVPPDLYTAAYDLARLDSVVQAILGKGSWNIGGLEFKKEDVMAAVKSHVLSMNCRDRARRFRAKVRHKPRRVATRKKATKRSRSA